MRDSGLQEHSDVHKFKPYTFAAGFEFEVHGMSMKRSLHGAIAALSLTAFALGGGASPASARYDEDRWDEPVIGTNPVLAVVGLAEQRISIYDAKGKIMEAPVSSGQNGLETPAGIFSIVQKEEEHHSNLFEDGSMPFMERITWTGISLHAGVLPGYAASHGCVRMPHGFAEKLYDVTKLGMRVIVVREDIAPGEIAQPAIFTPAVAPQAADGAGVLSQLKAAVRNKYMESLSAQRREKEAKQAASKRADEAAAATRAVQAAEAGLAKAEAEAKDADRDAGEHGAAEAAASTESVKAKALAKVEAAQAQLSAAKLDAQAKAEAAQRASADARAAAAEASRAADASEEAQQSLSPVSVFISRKTQRLYVRRNNLPVYESPVAIRDADKPIGSFVFTALDYTGTPGTLRWNVVSMYKNAAYKSEAADEAVVPVAKGKAKPRHNEAAPADVAGAEAALNRLTVPQEAKDRIAAGLLPGSSLIVSDEGASGETGKDTDFVVVMSAEPQGGLTSRHHPQHRDDEFFGEDSIFGRFSSSSRRPGGGGFPFFFSD